MKTYQVWAHSGLAWLFDIGQYDDFAEANYALYNEYVRQSESVEPDKIKDFEELFFLESRIVEVDTNEEKLT
jgi:hypothetical protein